LANFFVSVVGHVLDDAALAVAAAPPAADVSPALLLFEPHAVTNASMAIATTIAAFRNTAVYPLIACPSGESRAELTRQ
jgi:hypothetical protein